MTPFLISLQNVPQRFEIELDGTTYILENRWNDWAGYWELDWYDALGEPLVMAVVLAGGVNIIEPYPELPAGGMVVLTSGDDDIDPTLEGLGVESQVYYVGVP